eukprot:5797857-Alexandrium_andersonii.AAC.1
MACGRRHHAGLAATPRGHLLPQGLHRGRAGRRPIRGSTWPRWLSDGPEGGRAPGRWALRCRQGAE